jgi:hypothetical protein
MSVGKPSVGQPGTSGGLRPGVWLFLGIVAAFSIGVVLQKMRHTAATPEAGDPLAAEAAAEPEAAALESGRPPVAQPQVSESVLESDDGIRVTRARLAGSGASVELTYQVTDVEKAKSLAERYPKSFLVVLSNGTRLGIGTSVDLPPGINQHARSRAAMLSNPQGWGFPPAPYRLVKDKVYTILVPNVRNAVVPGAECVLETGPHQSARLIVEAEESKP